MVKLDTSLKTKRGLNARAAATFVQHTNKYISDILIAYQDVVVDAKSIMGILALGIIEDANVVITIDGVDEQYAKQALSELLEVILPEL